jgi:hypothetical protein
LMQRRKGKKKIPVSKKEKGMKKKKNRA